MLTTGLWLPAYLVRWLLRRLPGPLLARLDAWSHAVARRRLQRRVRAGASASR